MRRTFALVLRFTRPVRPRIAALLVLTALLALSSAAPSYFMRSIIDVAMARRDPRVLDLAVVCMIVNAIVFALAGYLQGTINVRVSQAISRALRRTLADRIYRIPLANTSASGVGGLITRLTSDVDGLESLWSGALVSALSNATQLALGLTFIFTFSWQLGLVALAIVPAFVLPATRLGKSIYAARIASRTIKDRFGTVVAETLSAPGIAFIKARVRYLRELERLDGLNRAMQDTDLHAADIGLRYSLFNSVVTMSTPAVVWFVGYWLVGTGALTLGALLATITLLLRLFMPASSLAGLQMQLTGSGALVARLCELLDCPPETDGDTPVLRPDVGRDAGIRLRFEGVSLAYDAGDVLRDVSFEVFPGEAVALCGPSGSGKTTIARILMRFIEPQGGRILADDIDVRALDLHEFRSRIAFVQQEPFLLNDTITANVALGTDGVDDAAIARACEAACADDFISSLPDGYRTVVGDRGARLSGGQRQRIALARLFLQQPALVVLDEATSALDVETERRVLANVAARFPHCARIIITHRESTLDIMDRVIRLRDGRVADRALTLA